MLDAYIHQGMGLHLNAPQSDLRVAAVVSQGNEASALETLWQVCSSLQALGYPVVVLDGTAIETKDAPGLRHLMEQAPWQDGMAMDAVASSLAVMPAARGLADLAARAQSATPALQELLPFFRSYSVLVLHAPAAVLAPLVRASATTPLVIMTGGAEGVVNSYKALKQIALDAGKPCMVAALVDDTQADSLKEAENALQTLQECAARHLGSPVRTAKVHANRPQDLQRLALQLLENAGSMGSAQAALPLHNASDIPMHFVRSH